MRLLGVDRLQIENGSSKLLSAGGSCHYYFTVILLKAFQKVFVMKYGDNLSNPTSLELPSGSGSVWKVDLRRLDGEIDYPLRKQEMEVTDDKDDDFHEDSSDDSIKEQLDDSTYPRKRRKKSSLPCPRPQKKKHDKFKSGSTSSTRRFEKRTPGFLGRIRPLPKSGKAIALQKANAYKSQHPLSVVVAMKPSYITGFLLISFL
ncbi:hypothetical protein GBA52_003284 [Prunus armeniaca]|nr:hypothetical protein GBA52_003284 [Prunus armeniaca]